jgi:hypothetical protein
MLKMRLIHGYLLTMFRSWSPLIKREPTAWQAVGRALPAAGWAEGRFIETHCALFPVARFFREAAMRKARLWWSDRFCPEKAADYLKIDRVYGTSENRNLRQVVTYWGMVASSSWTEP